jgi:photosystem II stability/assembly factor-like uncharacterized protein
MVGRGMTGVRGQAAAGVAADGRAGIGALALVALFIAVLLVAAPAAMARSGAQQERARAVSAGAWTAENSGTSANLGSVTCVNAWDAWASGADGTVLRTKDGGATWTRLTTPIPGAEATENKFIQGVAFVNPTVGWAIGRSNVIAKTTDSGDTWTVSGFQGIASSLTFNCLCACDPSHAWIGAYRGGPLMNNAWSLALYTNNGTDWGAASSMVASSNFGHGIFGMDFVDATHGWATTVDAVTSTIDGGNTWSPLSVPGESSWWVSAPGFADALNGWLVGQDYAETSGQIMRTSDNGRTWQQQAQSAISSAGITQVNAIDAVSTSIAWAVCDGGYVLHTADGGATWTVEQPTTQNLYGVHFIDGDTGWIVGNGGVVLRHGPAAGPSPSPTPTPTPTPGATPSVTLKASPKSVKTGHSVKLSGKVTNGGSATSVSICRKVGAKLTVLKRVALKSGAFSWSRKMTKAGKWVLVATCKVGGSTYSSKAVTVAAHR